MNSVQPLQAIASTLLIASTPVAAIHEHANHFKRLFVGTAVNQFRLKAGFEPIGEHAQECLVAFDEWNAKNVDTQMGHDAIESPAH